MTECLSDVFLRRFATLYLSAVFLNVEKLHLNVKETLYWSEEAGRFWVSPQQGLVKQTCNAVFYLTAESAGQKQFDIWNKERVLSL